jgi:Fe-S-cluster containining protein
MARPSQLLHSEAVAQLCPQCALCCNGVLFKDVELQPGDDAERLKALGLPFLKTRQPKFPQPCAALGADRCCRIYSERPKRCREFECALLKSVIAGESEISTALRAIRDAHKRAERVKRLLRELGDNEESRALSLRFKRMQRRLESTAFSEAEADIFGELTLAVHDLNLLLRAKFYPTPEE